MRKCFMAFMVFVSLLSARFVFAGELSSMMMDARGAIMMGDYENAMSFCKDALAADPNFAEAYAVQSEAKFNLGDVEGAFEDAKKAIELTPEEWSINPAYFVRAMIALDQAAEPEAALEFITKAINFTMIEPVPEYYELRAEIHDKLGHKDLAEADLAKIDEIYADMGGEVLENIKQ